MKEKKITIDTLAVMVQKGFHEITTKMATKVQVQNLEVKVDNLEVKVDKIDNRLKNVEEKLDGMGDVKSRLKTLEEALEI